MFGFMEAKRDPRGQGDRGEMSAIVWLMLQGLPVFLPISHCRDFDLVTDFGDGLIRVQVKTSTCFRKGRWEVAVCTRGGNRSWNGIVKRLDASRYDYLFVLVADGRRWFIPSAAVGGGCSIRLGGPRYAEFQIDPDPVGLSPNERTHVLKSVSGPAGFPSGQRDSAVNAAAQPSQVRILPPPSRPCKGQHMTDGSELDLWAGTYGEEKAT
jgi:PD-(D/E)XK endonuclease